MPVTYTIEPANPARAEELAAERRARFLRDEREAAAKRRADLAALLGEGFMARFDATFPNHYGPGWKRPAQSMLRGSAPRVAFPKLGGEVV